MSTIQLEDNITLPIDISSPADIPAFFVFGLHKSGSTLINRIMVDVCRATDIPDVSIPTAASQAGLVDSRWRTARSLNDIVKDGYCYRGFRTYPNFLSDGNLIDQRKKIWLLRDPRDVVVSAYFSFKKSHVIADDGGELAKSRLSQRAKINELTLEEFVVDYAARFKLEVDLYLEAFDLDSELLRIYRYEDIIFEKEKWITDMLNFIGLEVPPARIKRIAEKHNIVPGQEDQSQHIRKVKPGDHIDKLSPECIQTLNGIFGDILERFKYAT